MKFNPQDSNVLKSVIIVAAYTPRERHCVGCRMVKSSRHRVYDHIVVYVI